MPGSRAARVLTSRRRARRPPPVEVGPQGSDVDAERAEQHPHRLVVGAQHGQGDVLAADLPGVHADGLAQRQLEHLLGTAPEPDATTQPEPSTAQVRLVEVGGLVAVGGCRGGPVEGTLAELAVDGLADGVEVDAERAQRRRVVVTERHRRRGPRGTQRGAHGILGDAVGGEQVASTVALLGEGQEQVDRAHLVGVEARAQVDAGDDDGAGVTREAFEHGSTSGRACGGRSAW